MSAVAVLIVNWNTRALLRECLQSVVDASVPVEVIVADNASQDGSTEMVTQDFPAVRLLALTENVGFVRGSNHAFAEADSAAPYVLLLNPDAALCPGALQTLTDWMDAHPDAGACGPLLLNPDDTVQPSWTRFPTLVSELTGRHDRRFRAARLPRLSVDALRALPEALRVDWVSGACILLRRAALDQLGGGLFDPALEMYSEETDLLYRLDQAGWPTSFVPSASVVHHSGQSSRQDSERAVRLLYRSKLLFFRKHYGPARAGLLRAALAILASLKWAVYALTGQASGRARQQAVLRGLRD